MVAGWIPGRECGMMTWLLLITLGFARAFVVTHGRLGSLPRAQKLTCLPSEVRKTRCHGPGNVLQLAASASPEVKTVLLSTGIDMEYRVCAGRDSISKPPLVFIHGSFHGSWCWAEYWMPFFAANGFSCFAMSLRGTSVTPQIGDAVSVQLSEHIDDIVSFLKEVVPASSPPPILVGHSFGGMYAQKICEANALDIRAMVLLCSVSPRGSSGTVMRYIFQKPKLAWEIVRAFVLKEAATDLAICRRVFFSETEPQESKVREYMERFAADSKVGLDTRTAPKQFPGKTSAGEDGRCAWLERLPPTLVVGADRDLVVDQEAVEETADFYASELMWVKGPHDIMLDPAGGETAAQQILEWLQVF